MVVMLLRFNLVKLKLTNFKLGYKNGIKVEEIKTGTQQKHGGMVLSNLELTLLKMVLTGKLVEFSLMTKNGSMYLSLMVILIPLLLYLLLRFTLQVISIGMKWLLVLYLTLLHKVSELRLPEEYKITLVLWIILQSIGLLLNKVKMVFQVLLRLKMILPKSVLQKLMMN